MLFDQAGSTRLGRCDGDQVEQIQHRLERLYLCQLAKLAAAHILEDGTGDTPTPDDLGRDRRGAHPRQVTGVMRVAYRASVMATATWGVSGRLCMTDALRGSVSRKMAAVTLSDAHRGRRMSDVGAPKRLDLQSARRKAAPRAGLRFPHPRMSGIAANLRSLTLDGAPGSAA